MNQENCGKMDVENLSYDELIELNERIVERLNQLDKVNRFMEMLEFARGDEVQFIATGGRQIRGRVVKLNQKTIAVVTPSGERWNVAPSFLSKVMPNEGEEDARSKVIDIGDQKKA